MPKDQANNLLLYAGLGLAAWALLKAAPASGDTGDPTGGGTSGEPIDQGSQVTPSAGPFASSTALEAEKQRLDAAVQGRRLDYAKYQLWYTTVYLPEYNRIASAGPRTDTLAPPLIIGPFLSIPDLTAEYSRANAALAAGKLTQPTYLGWYNGTYLKEYARISAGIPITGQGGPGLHISAAQAKEAAKQFLAATTNIPGSIGKAISFSGKPPLLPDSAWPYNGTYFYCEANLSAGTTWVVMVGEGYNGVAYVPTVVRSYPVGLSSLFAAPQLVNAAQGANYPVNKEHDENISAMWPRGWNISEGYLSAGSKPTQLMRGFGLSAGMNQWEPQPARNLVDRHFIPPTRTSFNPGMGQEPNGQVADRYWGPVDATYDPPLRRGWNPGFGQGFGTAILTRAELPGRPIVPGGLPHSAFTQDLVTLFKRSG